MVFSRSNAVHRANAAHTNKVGHCQEWVHDIFGAPGVGDVDHDHDADAVDGWLSEPKTHRHTDRHPPAGVPVAYSGGTHGYGHRAISLGNGLIRSTDAAGEGRIATVSLDWPERHWGLHYLGWSDTISGLLIPGAPAHVTPPKAEVAKHQTRGTQVDAALKALATAKGNGHRGASIKAARLALDKIDFL